MKKSEETKSNLVYTEIRLLYEKEKSEETKTKLDYAENRLLYKKECEKSKIIVSLKVGWTVGTILGL